jgi:histidinol-phosphate aminotransferase
MKTIDLEKLVRPNILRLKPYSSARKEFSGEGRIFLDANENSFGSPTSVPLNRYPDPLQMDVKEAFSRIVGLRSGQMFLGNGSDEAIDLILRILCEPRTDNIIICPPTYGMYEVSAEINDIEIRRVPLNSDFQLNVPAILDAVDSKTKLIFICSPNNPTGNAMKREDVISLLESFEGIVIVDEAYIHFSNQESLVSSLSRYQNLMVLQTFSKAWGLAGLRVGVAFADEGIIEMMNRIKPPYNLSTVAQEIIIEALENQNEVKVLVGEILKERERMREILETIHCVEKVFDTDANFLLVRVNDADRVYKWLLEDAIIVRNRNTVELCEGCIRITVGTRDENEALVESMRRFVSQ